MNKNAIQKYAIWARNELITQVKQRAYQYGISDKGYGDENAAVIAGRVLSTEERKQRREFVEQIQKNGYQQSVEEVAYTWFNRFIALRFMEVNDYLPTHVRVFSDANGGFNPEILKDVLHLELEGLDKSKVSELLNANQTEELYRYLLLAQCNALNAALPEMFEKLGGYTEMLLPNNILKLDGVLGRLVSDIIPEDTWLDGVQIIGWMYQYYNTEPKQAVFDGLKKNIKITKEKIPAATQLFTPDWIVRYMVENSLGRLWIEHLETQKTFDFNYIDFENFSFGEDENKSIAKKQDSLKSNWKYYLEEAEQDDEVKKQLYHLRMSNKNYDITTIKLIDPCMGSGHILVYAFDVLMQIYESEGYNPRDAAKLILEKNIYGLEIDKRAYQLAYFALMMKARQYNRRILTLDIKPNVFYFIDSNRILEAHLDLMGADLMPVELSVCKENIPHLLNDFNDATEYGSLLKIDREYPYELLRKFAKSQKTGQMTISDNPQNYYDTETSEMDLLQIIDLAEILAQKYDVVVTNPPYMGSNGIGAKLLEFVKNYYPDSKSDLFAVFIEKCGELLKAAGYQAMITQHAWMFLSSFQKLRGKLLQRDIINMAHLGARAFEEIGGEIVQTTAFVLSKRSTANFKATYVRLVDYNSQDAKEEAFLTGKDRHTSNRENFKKIPGRPVAYWVSGAVLSVYDKGKTLGEIASPKTGMTTGDNEKFLRLWQEVDIGKSCFHAKNAEDAKMSGRKWFTYSKGGGFRRWYGYYEYLVNWGNNGFEIKNNVKSNGLKAASVRSESLYFKPLISWSAVTSAQFSCRYVDGGSLFDSGGSSVYVNKNAFYLLAVLNSKIGQFFLNISNATLNYQPGDIAAVPIVVANGKISVVEDYIKHNISLSRTDWDSFETSWDFKRHPLI